MFAKIAYTTDSGKFSMSREINLVREGDCNPVPLYPQPKNLIFQEIIMQGLKYKPVPKSKTRALRTNTS